MVILADVDNGMLCGAMAILTQTYYVFKRTVKLKDMLGSGFEYVRVTKCMCELVKEQTFPLESDSLTGVEASNPRYAYFEVYIDAL